MESRIAGQASADARPLGARRTRPLVELVPVERWETIQDWDETVGAAARRSVFLTRDWVLTWWRILAAMAAQRRAWRVEQRLGRREP
jgi:hypothetical protein